jgi:hypothetical protein
MFLWLAFALNGLGFANHNAALLTAPILIAITVLNLHQRRLRWQDIAACAAVWLVGSLPYTWLIVAGLKASGDWAGVVRSALFGHSYSEEVLNSRLSTKKLFVSACFIGLNFPNLTIPLAMLGLLAARQYAAGVRRILYANLLIHFLFVIRYPVVDQHTFFLPTYFLTAAFAGLGMARLFQLSPWGRRVVWAAVVFLCTTPVVYAFVPGLARRFDVLAGYARNKPFRDDYAYVFTPWTAFDHSAERMARRALELGGSDALVIAPDSMVAPAIWYEAWLSGKDRVEVVGVFDAEQIAQAAQSKRRVLFVPPRTTQEPDAVAGGTWRREDDFYLLQPGEAGGGP